MAKRRYWVLDTASFYRLFYLFLNQQKIINKFAIIFMNKSQNVVDIAQEIV